MEEIILLITVLVTIVGWIFTGAQQLKIVRETRNYQRKDRELAIYRTRMDKASELTKAFVIQTTDWHSLSAFANAILDVQDVKIGQQNLLNLYGKVGESRTKIYEIIYDPQYRALRNLLNKKTSEGLDNVLKNSALQVQDFFDKTKDTDFSSPQIRTQIKYISDEALSIGNNLISITNLFSNAFAELDKSLTEDE